MIPRKLPTILCSCLFSGIVGTAATMTSSSSQPADELALFYLQSDFHGAGAAGDLDLMESLWTEDAVFTGGGNVVTGPEDITNFLSASPLWGTSAQASPTYKSQFDIRGTRATIRFECIIIGLDVGDPLTTALSSLPPGSQNPDAEIVQHSNATVEAVKQGGVWRMASFTGAGGAIQP